MSVAENVPAVATVTARLQSLLSRARQLRHAGALKTPLPTLEFEAEIKDIANSSEPIDASLGKDPVSQPQHAVVETAARSIFYALLASSDITSPGFNGVWHFLDLLQACSDHKQCDTSLTLWLIEELLDSQTIEGCRTVFDYLESRRERLITNAFSKNKQMILLRCCNELLRRLSRAEDAVFCGRVFIFLFQSFPLGDKSSVNLRGEFHVENKTSFDVALAKSKTGDRMEVDANEGEADGQVLKGESAEQKVDGSNEADNTTPRTSKATQGTQATPDETELDMDELYGIFWALQDVFSNPTKAFLPSELQAFQKGLEMTLKKFKSIPKALRTQGSSGATETNSKKRKHNTSDEHGELANTFNPKYLTSRDLFELEVHDMTFQRHILVQSLILIEFLLSLTPKAKKRLTEVKAQRAMLYNFTLSDEDATWANNMRLAISTYLQDGPDGKFYFRMVDNVLARDKNWVRWKVESCPPIQRPPISTDEYAGAKEGAKKACTSRRLKAPMGALDLEFVHDTENVNNLGTLRDPKRYVAPTIDGLLRDISTAELDIEFAEGEEKKILEETKAARSWMLLRLAAKNKFALFDKVDESKNLDVLGKNAGKTGQSDKESAAGTPDVKAEPSVTADGIGTPLEPKHNDDKIMDQESMPRSSDDSLLRANNKISSSSEIADVETKPEQNEPEKASDSLETGDAIEEQAVVHEDVSAAADTDTNMD